MKRIANIIGSERPALWLRGTDGDQVNTGIVAFDCSTPFTWMAWVYPDFAGSDGTTRTILSKRQTENGLNAFAALERTASQTNFRFHMRNEGDATFVDYTSNSGTLRPFAWTHVCVVYNYENLWMYANGSLARTVASESDTGTPLEGAWRIGHNARLTNRPWKGGVSEAAIFSGALTAAQIKEAMNRGLTGSEAGLVAFWPLDERSGALVYNKDRDARKGAAVTGGRWAVRSMR